MTFMKTLTLTKTGKTIRIVVPKDWLQETGMSGEKTVDAIGSGGIMALIPKKPVSDEELDKAFFEMKQMIQMKYRERGNKTIKVVQAI